ncbi:MAG: YidC/Oxa1 family membrane protein insertase, partial [Microbacteriaceae bacterium]|nr:YidC/Oxa1 family membrane protein insertase [Microbacteriaceae bacterium]
FGLFSVLNSSFNGLTGVGLLNEQLSREFGRATLFGIAPLGSTMVNNDGNVWVIVIAAVLIVLMTASQFITQLQIMSKNQSPEMKASPMYRQQRILLYILPVVFLFSGVAFPLGVMFYWFVSNIWTMVQQFIVIRNMPTPGSDAALAREARLAKKRQRRGIVDDETEAGPEGAIALEEPKKTQRPQPVSKNRAKKKGGR